jgi:hypothetical protein
MSATGPRWPKTNACVHPARAAISRAVGPQSPPRAAPLPRLPRPPSASAPTSCRADPSRCEPDQTLPFDLRLSNLFELLLKYSTPGAPVGPCGRSLSSDAVRAGQLAGGAIRMIGPGNAVVPTINVHSLAGQHPTQGGPGAAGDDGQADRRSTSLPVRWARPQRAPLGLAASERRPGWKSRCRLRLRESTSGVPMTTRSNVGSFSPRDSRTPRSATPGRRR